METTEPSGRRVITVASNVGVSRRGVAAVRVAGAARARPGWSNGTATSAMSDTTTPRQIRTNFGIGGAPLPPATDRLSASSCGGDDDQESTRPSPSTGCVTTLYEQIHRLDSLCTYTL